MTNIIRARWTLEKKPWACLCFGKNWQKSLWRSQLNQLSVDQFLLSCWTIDGYTHIQFYYNYDCVSLPLNSSLLGGQTWCLLLESPKYWEMWRSLFFGESKSGCWRKIGKFKTILSSRNLKWWTTNQERSILTPILLGRLLYRMKKILYLL
jgi:hypothetical protein